MNWVKKEIQIKDVEILLKAGYEIEVDSPDGWVGVNYFINKGEFEEYLLKTESGLEVKSNEGHLYKTNLGWKRAKDLLNSKSELIETVNGQEQFKVTKTGNIIPIVDINVEHDNHRYYTNGVESHNTGVGKTAFMCHLASANLMSGYNVLYLTLEMSEEKIAERIDANTLDTQIQDFKHMDKKSYLSKIDNIKGKTSGKLIIKEYPTASASAANFRHLINELKIKKNFTPDIIYVDYLNICASSRVKNTQANSYTIVKSIAEEIRGLAIEFDLPIVTATQTNRQGTNNSDIELTEVSECIHVDEQITLKDNTTKKIGEVSIGDQIKSNDGYKTVTLVHHKKIKDCFKINLKSGNSIIVSREHKFPTDYGRVSINDGLDVGYKLNNRAL